MCFRVKTVRGRGGEHGRSGLNDEKGNVGSGAIAHRQNESEAYSMFRKFVKRVVKLCQGDVNFGEK